MNAFAKKKGASAFGGGKFSKLKRAALKGAAAADSKGGALALLKLGKAALERAEHAFMKQANNKGRVLESFEILTLTGWKD